jgi:2-iminoacetate synthase ThiH
VKNGTIIEEHIFHMAGAKSPQLQTEAEMVKAKIHEDSRTAKKKLPLHRRSKVCH